MPPNVQALLAGRDVDKRLGNGPPWVRDEGDAAWFQAAPDELGDVRARVAADAM